jgi:nitronate monooxygenase
MSAYTELVGCRLPIQQAPMGTVSSPDLAVAVADAGGVGTITALGIPASQLDVMLAGMASRTSGILSVNFLTNGWDPEAVVAAAGRVRLVDFFWADPDAKAVELVHANGALVAWQVGTVAEALAAVDVGCDVVVVQGREAGGHVRGDTPLLSLLADVLDGVSVPVLASGGIGNAQSVSAVLAAGAAGVRVGTRFIATVESGAHALYKQAIVDATDGDTEITDAFAVCPLCATSPRVRVLRSCIDAVHTVAGDVVGETMIAGERVSLPKGSGMPPGATATGHIGAMAMYAGVSVADVRAIQPAAHVIAELFSSRPGI